MSQKGPGKKDEKAAPVQKFKLKKGFPSAMWLRSVWAIQFDGSFAAIHKIGECLELPTRMDRHFNHKAQCKIIRGDPCKDIFVRKSQWVVWNRSILPLKTSIQTGDVVWDDALFQKAYRRTRKSS